MKKDIQNAVPLEEDEETPITENEGDFLKEFVNELSPEDKDRLRELLSEDSTKETTKKSLPDFPSMKKMMED